MEVQTEAVTEQRGEEDASQRAAAAAAAGELGRPPPCGFHQNGGVVSVKVSSRKNNQQVLESDFYHEAPTEEHPLHRC